MSERLIPAFEGYDGVTAGFSTRKGGVSKGDYASLNPGIFSGDDKALIEQNLRLICGDLGVGRDSLIFNRQVHGNTVTKVTDPDMCRDICDADCFVTDLTGVTLTCVTADCVPILFYDPVKKVIATAHAGWRGTVCGAQRAALHAMLDMGCRAGDILIEIGPCISSKAYEVSREVADLFDFDVVIGGDDKPHLDLRAANKKILLSCGIRQENIKVSPLCTYFERELFFSHRRTGLPRGTQTAFIALR